MYKLDKETKERILTHLLMGVSMRATAQSVGCSFNAVARFQADAGVACDAYHKEYVRGIQGKRFIECDEVWAFIYAKERNLPNAKSPPPNAGNVWMWTAIDSDSRLMISYLPSEERSEAPAHKLMADLASRLVDPPEIYTDGLPAYIDAVRESFGENVNFGQLVKDFERGKPPKPQDPRYKYTPTRVKTVSKRVISGKPNVTRLGTSHVERSNLTMRMAMRRYTRLTNAHSKRIEAHMALVHTFFFWYNFVRPHMSLSKGRNKVTPAMAAGLATEPVTLGEMVDMIEAAKPPPKKPGPKVGTVYFPRKKRSRRW